MTAAQLWERYQRHLCECETPKLALDVSRMLFDDQFLPEMELPVQQAYQAMRELEAGALANPDEKRRVGHYWLRAPQLAPRPADEPDIPEKIVKARREVEAFAAKVRAGEITAPSGKPFAHALVVGIGGSALGPQFVSQALGDTGTSGVAMHFMDNTDPDGMSRVLRTLAGKLGETLVIVISKSGDTPETANGKTVTEQAYAAAGLDFAKHAVAITGEGSTLDKEAEPWLRRFPMWDWVGGRTSLGSAVGLLPAALEDIDTEALLDGMAACDEVTRCELTAENPAALLALMWYYAVHERGKCSMVVLPYKDLLELFGRYLQQLVMESQGKALDRKGKRVKEGLAVYGNKGSTDQHAFVQQLRDGRNDFFVTFIEVLEHGAEVGTVPDGEGNALSPGDFLHAFLQGTRKALTDNGRESLTVTIPRVDARNVGVLVALFERAVGYYAELVDLNAYNQPGVEAGKQAGAGVLAIRREVVEALEASSEVSLACLAEQVALRLGYPCASEVIELVAKQLEYLKANGQWPRCPSG